MISNFYQFLLYYVIYFSDWLILWYLVKLDEYCCKIITQNVNLCPKCESNGQKSFLNSCIWIVTSNILSYLPLQSPKKGLNWIINFRAKFNSSWNSMTSSNKFVFWPYFWRHGGLLIWLYHPIAQKSKFGICHPRGGTFLVRRCVKFLDPLIYKLL